jgi:hypothetical protein
MEDLEFKNVIDYRDIYNQLKNALADEYSKLLEIFDKLHQWKLNDTREE